MGSVAVPETYAIHQDIVCLKTFQLFHRDFDENFADQS